MKKIEINSLNKKFGYKKVLIDINFSVEEGESLVILGKSGTGKSVLLKCISGLIEPDSGLIVFDNKILSSKTKNDFFEQFGMLFQGGALFDSLKIWENITFKQKYFGIKNSLIERKEIAVEKLNQVGLKENIIELFPNQISGGMQRRVAIARAIASNPKIIFFDEPTAGLDPFSSNLINELIKNIISELGATAITISHDKDTIINIADRGIILDNNSIKWNGKINEKEIKENKYLSYYWNI